MAYNILDKTIIRVSFLILQNKLKYSLEAPQYVSFCVEK